MRDYTFTLLCALWFFLFLTQFCQSLEQMEMRKQLIFIVEKLKEPCAVYDVATDYVIISEKDIVGINKKEK